MKYIATVLSITLFTTGAFGYTPETNFWAARQVELRHSRESGNPVVNIKPKTGFPIKTFGNDGIAAVLKTLSPSIGSVQGDIPSGNGPVVIHIQDIHMDLEAQRNISRLLETFTQQAGIKLIGLEGAFGDINIQPLEELNKSTREKMAEQYLQSNDIGGPLHFALNQSTMQAILWGVDDAALYKDNWAAVISAFKKSAALKTALEKQTQRLQKEKEGAFNPALKEFDAVVQKYRHEEITLGDYVEYLSGESHAWVPSLELFSEANALEKKVSIPVVEQERNMLLSYLVQVLPEKERAELVQHAADLSPNEFYSELFSLAQKNNRPILPSSQLWAYVTYLKLTAKINTDTLFDEIKSAEAEIYDRLVQTFREQALVERSNQLHFSKKLIDFSLTNKEWAGYKKQSNPQQASFEAFYETAQKRDTALAVNLISAMKQFNAPTAVLVTGGFHSAGIQSQLRHEGVRIVTISPRIEKMDQKKGSQALFDVVNKKGVFDDLFVDGDLFLPAPTWSPDIATKLGISGALDKSGKDGTSLANRLMEPLGRKISSGWTVFGSSFFIIRTKSGWQFIRARIKNAGVSMTKLYTQRNLENAFLIGVALILSMSIAKTPFMRLLLGVAAPAVIILTQSKKVVLPHSEDRTLGMSEYGRDEYKYASDEDEFDDHVDQLENRLGMTRDPFSKNGPYPVLSIYFDNLNPADFLFLEMFFGREFLDADREKIRIRFYPDATEQNTFFAEVKRREGYVFSKIRVQVLREFLRQVATGRFQHKWLIKPHVQKDRMALQRFSWYVRRFRLQPFAWILYWRMAFHKGKTRVNIDRKMSIALFNRTADLLGPDLAFPDLRRYSQIFPIRHQQDILEIKYEVQPDPLVWEIVRDWELTPVGKAKNNDGMTGKFHEQVPGLHARRDAFDYLQPPLVPGSERIIAKNDRQHPLLQSDALGTDPKWDLYEAGEGMHVYDAEKDNGGTMNGAEKYWWVGALAPMFFGINWHDLLTTLMTHFHGCSFALLGALMLGHIYRKTMVGQSYDRKFTAAIMVLPPAVAFFVMVLIKGHVVFAVTLGILGILGMINLRAIIRNVLDMMYLVPGLAIGVAAGTGAYMVSMIGAAIFWFIFWFLWAFEYGMQRRIHTTLSFTWTRDYEELDELEEFMAYWSDPNDFKFENMSEDKKTHTWDAGMRVRLRNPWRMKEFIGELANFPGVEELEHLPKPVRKPVGFRGWIGTRLGWIERKSTVLLTWKRDLKELKEIDQFMARYAVPGTVKGKVVFSDQNGHYLKYRLRMKTSNIKKFNQRLLQLPGVKNIEQDSKQRVFELVWTRPAAELSRLDKFMEKYALPQDFRGRAEQSEGETEQTMRFRLLIHPNRVSELLEELGNFPGVKSVHEVVPASRPNGRIPIPLPLWVDNLFADYGAKALFLGLAMLNAVLLAYPPVPLPGQQGSPPAIVMPDGPSSLPAKSPGSGKITEVYVTPGHLVVQGQPLAKVQLTDPELIQKSIDTINARRDLTVSMLKMEYERETQRLKFDRERATQSGDQIRLNQLQVLENYIRLQMEVGNHRVLMNAAQAERAELEKVAQRNQQLTGNGTVALSTYETAMAAIKRLEADAAGRKKLIEAREADLKILFEANPWLATLTEKKNAPEKSADEPVTVLEITPWDAALKLAEAEASQISLELPSEKIIVAPMNGRVTSVLVGVGSFVTDTDLPFTIISTRKDFIYIYLAPGETSPVVGGKFQIISRDTRGLWTIGEVIADEGFRKVESDVARDQFNPLASLGRRPSMRHLRVTVPREFLDQLGENEQLSASILSYGPEQVNTAPRSVPVTPIPEPVILNGSLNNHSFVLGTAKNFSFTSNDLKEYSGLTYFPSRDTYLMVDDEAKAIVEYKPDGTLVRKIDVSAFASKEGQLDLEGIAWLGYDDKFMLLIENRGVIVLDLPEGKVVNTREEAKVFNFSDDFPKNFEGLAYNPQDGTVWLATQDGLLYKYTWNRDTQKFVDGNKPIALQGKDPVGDIAFAPSVTGNMLVLTRGKTPAILEVEIGTGKEIGKIELNGSGLGQPEGMASNQNGDLDIVSENVPAGKHEHVRLNIQPTGADVSEHVDDAISELSAARPRTTTWFYAPMIFMASIISSVQGWFKKRLTLTEAFVIMVQAEKMNKDYIDVVQETNVGLGNTTVVALGAHDFTGLEPAEAKEKLGHLLAQTGMSDGQVVYVVDDKDLASEIGKTDQVIFVLDLFHIQRTQWNLSLKKLQENIPFGFSRVITQTNVDLSGFDPDQWPIIIFFNDQLKAYRVDWNSIEATRLAQQSA